MKKFLSALGCIAALTACQEWGPVFTLDNPNTKVEEMVEISAKQIITIADLAATYNLNDPRVMTESKYIAGKVSSTDQPGNFYKSFYIQDETGGIEIKIGQSALYNEYHEGQTIYVKLQELTLGMYGYKEGSSYGYGMIQVGYEDPSGNYETSYLESPLLIDAKVLKGAMGDPVEPVVVPESSLPTSKQTQADNKYVGRLVTIKDLKYGWYDSGYDEHNEVFALLYIDSAKSTKESSNRIFVSGTAAETGVNTLAMSKGLMTENLYSGKWDSFNIGNANDYNYGKVGDWRQEDSKGNLLGYYKDVWVDPKGNEISADEAAKIDGAYSYRKTMQKAAASVSQYFSTPGGTCVQIRTSGYCKFNDYELPADVLNGSKKINVTGVLALYQGKIQMTVNRATDITYADGTPIYTE